MLYFLVIKCQIQLVSLVLNLPNLLLRPEVSPERGKAVAQYCNLDSIFRICALIMWLIEAYVLPHITPRRCGWSWEICTSVCETRGKKSI